MKLKLASAVLALLMLMASLCACKKGGDNPGETTGKNDIPVLTTTAATVASSSATTTEPVQTSTTTVATSAATTAATTTAATTQTPAAEIQFVDCNDTVYVISSALNVRTSPEVKDDNIYTAVTEGTALARTGYSDKWCRVKIEDKICYVSAAYVTAENPNAELAFTARYEEVFVTADSLNIRENPSSTAKIYSTVSKGTQMTRVGYHEDWSRIMYDGKMLYCATKYLSTESPVATTTAATTTATTTAATTTATTTAAG